jgi:hypothetical protein
MELTEGVATGAALVAAIIAAIALWYTRLATRAAQRQVAAAEDQTQLQRQLRIDAAQPYVWIDIRPSDEHAQLLVLYLGNSGPTVATDVRVTFDPAIQLGGRHVEATEQLTRGILALPPGRVMHWQLGVSNQQVPAASPDGYLVRITGDGPFGPLDPLEYLLDVAAFGFTLGTASGTLHGVAVAIEKGVDKLINAAKHLEASRRSDSEEGGNPG